MKLRRKFLVGAGVLAAFHTTVFAQQSEKPRRIGFLWGSSQAAATESGAAKAFEQGMREQGYIESRDYVIDAQYAGGRYAELNDIARLVARGNFDVVVTTGAAATRAMQLVTSTTPIVFATVNDAISTGFGKSLARPGGNLTGMSRSTVDITPKHIELLRIFSPKLSHVAVLFNGGNPSHASVVSEVQSVAQKVGISVQPLSAGSVEEIRRGFSAEQLQKSQAVIVLLDQLFLDHKQEIAQLALKARLLSIYSVPEDVRAGGLISYGPLYSEFFRQSARHVVRILKGAKPGDLPIEQPTRFHLAINSKTAKALGLALSPELRLRSDEVIE